MKPDTEKYLTDLRTRLLRERAAFRLTVNAPQQARAWLDRYLMRDHAARIGARLRSLRDWPQPGRPA